MRPRTVISSAPPSDPEPLVPQLSGGRGRRTSRSLPPPAPVFEPGLRGSGAKEPRPSSAEPSRGALRIHALHAHRGARVSWITVHRVLKRHRFIVRVVQNPSLSSGSGGASRFRLADRRVQVPHRRGAGPRVAPRHPRRSVPLPGNGARIPPGAGSGGHEQPLVGAQGRARPEGGVCRQRKLFHLKGVSSVLRGARCPRDLWAAVPSACPGEAEAVPRHADPGTGGRPRFRSLCHFRRELRGYRGRYNHARPHGGTGWNTPAEIYLDPKLESRVLVQR